MEFEFPEKISLASLESDGWARIEDGTCRLGIRAASALGSDAYDNGWFEVEG